MNEPIPSLNDQECHQIADILSRRANEIAMWESAQRETIPYPASVKMAVEIEIERLRNLARKLTPAPPTDAEIILRSLQQ